MIQARLTSYAQFKFGYTYHYHPRIIFPQIRLTPSSKKEYILWSKSRGNNATLTRASIDVNPGILPLDPSYSRTDAPFFDALSDQFDVPLTMAEKTWTMDLTYNYSLGSPTPNQTFADLLIFFQWGFANDGPMKAPPLSDFQFTFEPVSAIQAYGEAFVQTFTATPPQFSVVLAQKIFIQALKSIPKFQITLTVAYPMTLDPDQPESEGSVFCRGFLGVHLIVAPLIRAKQKPEEGVPTQDWVVL